MDRYTKNRNMLSQDECDVLKNKSVCVIGCGGLGGYVIEMLGRIGVGKITAVDGDVFDVSNLNRQLLSTEVHIGLGKAVTAKERMEKVNSDVELTPVTAYLTQENALDIVRGHDLVIDALDSIETRFLLQKAASELGIPMIYGAIAGWYGQVSTIMPGDDFLSKIYRNHKGKGHEAELGNPSFSPALVASLQVSEAVKVLIGRGELLKGKLLLIDLFNNDFEVVLF
ncbi:Molybdopterin biosynthesis protein MoeB [Petrocella atlantisensis]|uniref:Molybdopterin biosynthesis protein MoeB n=1 Tax=Petrocella atlantisensis TaxID=2173034 RepID=A0A3P7RV02_9FIRM|nr:HesA/MoeB/ThiF family protein [Petrocella atlantisensis]VDN46616.1 Molybdopterin biosynthesis protein MoeB [Petrocella atlantisensis]